ncbi:cellulase family glycosylhydrolase [Rhodopila sp.]|uniref:cellulase family glycosylhydrolase n=1 Tax=Rhodopila sp. TaxID=2480087 RepID=UPI003D11F5A6
MTANSLLSPGYLSTRGAQVVDANGDPVSLESIAWFGTEGPSGSTLTGLSSNNPNDASTASEITASLANIVNEGFNTLRIPWSDVNLTTSLPMLQAVVADAGQLGLKIIFDHHDDDGHYSQQGNGLWYDSGGASGGTDGNGDTGTITAAQFQADSVTLANAFAGNSTVVGFDLDNEPFIGGTGVSQAVNWGGGGPNDILAMYNTVGSAVEAADPGALIVAEGPQNWGGTLFNGSSGLAPEGDLSQAAAMPVTLTANGDTVANKVLYSVHEYPSTIGGEPTDSGASYIAQMNAAWGYLEASNTAPVWIGEIGASLDNTGTDSSTGAKLADEQAWAATIVSYLNGQDAAAGGPSVKTGFDWWANGTTSGGAPDEYNSGVNGTVQPGQQAVVGQLLTYNNTTNMPAATAAPATAQNPGLTASPNDTTLMAGSSGSVVDAQGNAWTITSSGQVALNGAADPTTANVTELAYANGLIWQQNTAHLWWSKSQPSAAWDPSAGPSNSPVPPAATTPNSNDSVINGAGQTITDAAGNQWAIDGSGQITFNGVADTSTANVIKLANINGTIWQEDSANLWWDKTAPTDPWGPANGTSTSPLPTIDVAAGSGATSINALQPATHVFPGATVSVTGPGVAYVTLGSTSDVLQFIGTESVTIVGGSAASTVSADGGANTFNVGSGAMTVTGGTGADAYLTGIGGGALTVTDFDVAKGDTISIDPALRGSMTTAPDRDGGTMIGFGSVAGPIDLKSVTVAPTVQPM